MRARSYLAVLALPLAISMGAVRGQRPATARLATPVLPDTPYRYADAALRLPDHFTTDSPDRSEE
ncbi:MAG: hypothetical protein QGG89_15240, partial [Vicinamibacterales bacterium]|nr:hypothetical protein [Vicinamibacterales bacterium]